ncbi:cyclase [Penicillium maclennaniae]|uniref:cyclase n=1 Tax=Penicillium maclennaniae TaxID=1343394 RepID=UPI0025415159|nr:cyclase [Penicillium maclennaniae]KAJ5677138.1 cyclase [Penicillium maclennaniae]
MSNSIQAPDQLPWDPNCTRFPRLNELPQLPNAPEGAAWVWGKDDQLGRLNLLTPQRVKESAKEIQSGELVRLDLPLNVPATPAADREVFQHTIKTLIPDIAFDDTYALNTQSSTQWDGFRHCAHFQTKLFYNGASSTDFVGDASNLRCSIHHWANHGIAGRGILLDYRHYALTHNKSYDPYTPHEITFSELEACAKYQKLNLLPQSQGGDIRIGDILLIRSGFVETYYAQSPAERYATATRSHENLDFAGLSREEEMREWLHDCYFAGVAGDSPTFEAWPVQGMNHLHQSLLALWGIPIGEMWDLERLAELCRERGRWTFFLTSAPANVPGGVGSHANATAIL